MTSSLPVCAPDLTSRGDNLFRACGFILQKTVYLWAAVFVPSFFEPARPFLIWLSISCFCSTVSAAAGFIQQARRFLPLGNRRDAVLLWLWQVPMTPFLVFLASGLGALRKEDPTFLESAQHVLWGAGVLALLSLVQTLLGGDRPVIRGIRLVLWIGVVALFPFYFVASPLAAVAFSGKYDMTLTLAAAALIPLSFWALRFVPREDFLRDMPMSSLAAARQLEDQGGWAERMLSVSCGVVFAKGVPSHWLLQIVARSLFSYHCLFLFMLNLLVHYGSASPALTRNFPGALVVALAALQVLPLMGVQTLRRLPLSTLTIVSVTMGTALCVPILLFLPTVVFQRISGSNEVEFLFGNLFSWQTLGIFWVKGGLIMACWTLQICLRGYLGANWSKEGSLRDWPLVVVSLAGSILAVLYEQLGWHADFAVGSVLMVFSVALYYGMIRWGDRIYRFTGSTGGARGS